MTPTQDQVTAQLQLLLPALGMLAVTLGLGSKEQIGEVTSIVLVALGPLMILGGMVWSAIANTRKSLIKSVEADPNVAKVKMENTEEGRAIVEDTGPKVVIQE